MILSLIIVMRRVTDPHGGPSCRVVLKEVVDLVNTFSRRSHLSVSLSFGNTGSVSDGVSRGLEQNFFFFLSPDIKP